MNGTVKKEKQGYKNDMEGIYKFKFMGHKLVLNLILS